MSFISRADVQYSDAGLPLALIGRDAAGTRLALAAGAVIPQQLNPELLTDCVIGQLPDGRFVGWGANDASFDIRFWVSTAYRGGTITRVNASQINVQAGGLQDTAGVEIGGAGAGWNNAWTASNGDIIALGKAASVNTYHLFRMKPSNAVYGTAGTVGSDGAYSNKRACLDVGRPVQGGGGHVQMVRGLSQHAFCEARINGVSVYIFAEYNIASGRVAGGANDQVIAWRSTDAGATWSKLLEFNTSGTHVTDHFHGVVQDPYTGWVYFMTGDTGAECAVIAWDGVSAAPAANSSFATIAATPGWRVSSGNELRRLTCVLFGPAGLYTIPDADIETDDATTTAYVGITLPRTLDYVATIGPAPRVDNTPPVLAARHPSGWGVIGSFRTAGPQEEYFHLWINDDPNGQGLWRLAAKVRNYRTVTATPARLWFGTDGALYFAGGYGAGVQFSTAVLSGTTIRFVLSDGAGLVVFDGA